MTYEPEALITPSVNEVIAALFSQLMSVMGVKYPSWISRLLFPILYLPIRRMSCLAVQLDSDIAALGWNLALDRFQSNFVTRLELHGENGIPTRGPLMVVCNHPAALDVAILAAAIKREDLKVLASDIPIVQLLPHIAEHSIPVYYDLVKRIHTVRSAVRHLESGGAIFLFPRGNVEPDPAVSPGAIESLAGWSTSIELFLRRVPQTITVVAVAKGMLSPGWYKNPLINIWKKYEQRQKVAEIFQIASQLITGKTPAVTPTVYFASPRTIIELGGLQSPEGGLTASLVAQARQMLENLPAK
ncbi:MAG TPA: 1-acyl-sn-glycerol-3-phosphate acyltransferase [Anaerolineales bacterium]|nr:1-acyl-sn-glycerol-3-phosphate acyltransferase [Anaerolineales bacterium]